jgi:hypothetical protein
MMGIDPNTPPSTAVRDNNPPGGEKSDPVRTILSDFDRAAAYRQSNHESRWQEAAELYLAWNPGQKLWEGSKIPRANMQVHLIFQQVEALIPQIVDALTGNDLDFDVEPSRAGTTISQCHLVRDVINYQLRSLGGTHTRFLGWRECVRRMTKDGLIFGNGVAEWGWEGPYQVKEKAWERVQFPEFQTVMHPAGFQMNIPTGRMQSMAVPSERKRTVSQFWLDPCALMDFYIDPSTRGCSVQEGEFAIRRKLMTVAELAGYRGQEGWDIPSDEELFRLAKKKEWTQGDTTRQAMASAHGESIEPMEDFSRNPRLAKVEVLRYFTREKHQWLIGREHLAWNGENKYGALPFSNWTYVDVPNAFYGQSVPDICRTDQKLAKALIDGRLDEVALMLHPATVVKRGMFRSQSQSRMYPGRVIEADDPGKDFVRQEMGNVTQNAYTEVDSLEKRVQTKTGVTDLAVLGVASSGGNSANRTATGVQAQTNASNSRVHYLVGNFEDQTARPLLEVIWQLTREFMDPSTLLEIIGPDGQSLQLDPVDLLNADPRFVMKTAQRMKQRAALQGGGLNQLSQFILNPELGTLMEEQQGKVIDIEAYAELWCDTYNVRAFTLFRSMTPQEQQASQARKQGPDQAKMALQQARLQQMSADAHERDETQIVVAALQALANAGMLNLAMGQPTELGLKAKELQASIEGGQFEAAPAGGANA